MPKGLQKIAKIAKESKERRDQYEAGEGFQRALVLKPDQVATGRFLEEGDDVTYLYTHELPKKPGQSIADKVLCLDQDDAGVPCYPCEQGVSRGTRIAMNFIRYDEPKLKRGTDGKALKDNFGNYQYETTLDPATGQQVVVVEPALLLFSTGAGAGGRLAYLESENGGMTRHVCKIARTSDNTSPYMIDVSQKDQVPPAPWEVELFNKKVDPLKAVTQLGKRSIPAMTYGDMIRAYGGNVGSGFATAPNGEQEPVNTENNIYAQAAANNAAGSGTLNLGAFSS